MLKTLLIFIVTFVMAIGVAINGYHTTVVSSSKDTDTDTQPKFQNISIMDCLSTTAGYPSQYRWGTVHSVSITQPVKLHFNFQVLIKFSINRPISYATYRVIVSKTLHGTNITYLDYQLNFCDLWYYMYYQRCPIKNGHYTYVYNSTFFPAIFTKGLYHVKAILGDDKGDIKCCTAFDLKVIS